MLLDRYEILERLGAGGMAKVYRAHDHVLDRIVAVKILHDDLAEQAEVCSRFIREARIMARLRHANIVEIYDVITTGEQGSAMVMELVEGTDLASAIESDPQLSPELAVLLMRPVSDALVHAHGSGVIHRDIKPANVLIGRDGRIKLSDFGIAKIVDGTHLTRTGGFLGTPAYIAPEVCRGEVATEAADQYALAAMLYELVTGRLPFRGPNPIAILNAIQIGKYVDPRTLNPDIDDALSHIIARGLAPNVVHRFPDIRSFIAALNDHTAPISPDVEREIVSSLVDTPQSASHAARSASGRSSDLEASYDGSGRFAKSSKGAVGAVGAVHADSASLAGGTTSISSPTASATGHGPPQSTPIAGQLPSMALTGSAEFNPRGPYIYVLAGIATGALGIALILAWLAWSPDRSTGPISARSPAPVATTAGTTQIAPASADAGPSADLRPEHPEVVQPPPSTTPPDASTPVRKPPPPASKRVRKPASRRRKSTRRATPSPSETAKTVVVTRKPSVARSTTPAPADPVPEPTPKDAIRPDDVPKTGTLRLHTTPWANVIVDGQHKGRTPWSKDLVLPAGQHTLVLQNPGLPPRREVIRIRPGKITNRRVNLRAKP